MYEKIIVPLDGSELAEIALPYAEEMAARLGSEVTLLHVCQLDDDPYRRMRTCYLDHMIETTEQGARSCAGIKARELTRPRAALVVGDPAEEIVRHACEENADLIVMATRGRSGVGRWASGSVADEVVRTTLKPTALIRGKSRGAKAMRKGLVKRILVPLDGSERSETVLPFAQELALGLGAQIFLFRVLSTCYQSMDSDGYVNIPISNKDMAWIKSRAVTYMDELAERLSREGTDSSVELRQGVPADCIIDFADEISADLVAMSTRGHSGIGRWVFGSVADRVLHGVDAPLFVVKTAAG